MRMEVGRRPELARLLGSSLFFLHLLPEDNYSGIRELVNTKRACRTRQHAQIGKDKKLRNENAAFVRSGERLICCVTLQARLDQDNVYADQRPSQDLIFPSVKFSNEDTEELTYIKTDVDKLVDQKAAEWAVKGGIDDEWDSYLEQLNNMGLDRMREIYQKAYDEWAAQTK